MLSFATRALALGTLAQSYGYRTASRDDGALMIMTSADTFICLAPKHDRAEFWGSTADYEAVRGSLDNPADVVRLVELLATPSADLTTD